MKDFLSEDKKLNLKNEYRSQKRKVMTIFEIAEFILGLQDMGLSQDINIDDAREEIQNLIIKIKNDDLYQYLYDAADTASKNQINYHDMMINSKFKDYESLIKGKTNYGTKYSTIATFLLSLSPDNNALKYKYLCKLIEDAPELLQYYLSRGIENVIQ